MNVILKVRGFDNAVKVVNAMDAYCTSLHVAATPNGACQVRVSRWKGTDDEALEFARLAVPGARIHLPNVGLKLAPSPLYIVRWADGAKPKEAYFVRRQRAQALARKHGVTVTVGELHA